MVNQCVSECGNTRCRYNAASQRSADVRLVYMRDRPKMGCEGWQPVKGAAKPGKSVSKVRESGSKARKSGSKASAGAAKKKTAAKRRPKETKG